MPAPIRHVPSAWPVTDPAEPDTATTSARQQHHSVLAVWRYLANRTPSIRCPTQRVDGIHRMMECTSRSETALRRSRSERCHEQQRYGARGCRCGYVVASGSGPASSRGGISILPTGGSGWGDETAAGSRRPALLSRSLRRSGPRAPDPNQCSGHPSIPWCSGGRGRHCGGGHIETADAPKSQEQPGGAGDRLARRPEQPASRLFCSAGRATWRGGRLSVDSVKGPSEPGRRPPSSSAAQRHTSVEP
jgi:hypothetical protein